MQVRQQRTPPPRPLYGSLVAQVISEIKQRFIDGITLSNHLSTQLSMPDPETPLVRVKESRFKSVINTVKQSPYLNSITPKQDSLEDFLADLADEQGHQIDFVISIQQKIACDSDNKDFNALAQAGLASQVGKFELAFARPESQGADRPFQTQFHLRAGANRQDHEEVTVHIRKRFNLIIFQPEHLSLAQDPGDHAKDILWQLVKTPQSILFLCADGAGLNGQLMLILSIIKDYATIFVSKTASTIADEILKVLRILRINTPCLVLTNEQCYEAIRNAEILRNYMVAKRYLDPNLLHIKACLLYTSPSPRD